MQSTPSRLAGLVLTSSVMLPADGSLVVTLKVRLLEVSLLHTVSSLGASTTTSGLGSTVTVTCFVSVSPQPARLVFWVAVRETVKEPAGKLSLPSTGLQDTVTLNLVLAAATQAGRGTGDGRWSVFASLATQLALALAA